ncbi:MAG: DUF4143 domain-containing protein [Clostridiales bacterium]|nr:DUF4143 domain-containing protein [Clostridiales bacterium]
MDYLHRTIDNQFDLLMDAFGAVLIVGPKGCGKTTSAKQKAGSVIEFQDEEKRDNYLMLAENRPSRLLAGKKPILFDEWQDAPKIWGAIRKDVDDSGETGQYILTGSTSQTVETPHTGTLRIASMKMYPMSLYESGESNGRISLINLFNDRKIDDQDWESFLTVEDLILAICRGGWPRAVTNRKLQSRLIVAKTLFRQTVQTDISNVDKVKRNPLWAEAILRSYARNICQLTEIKSIYKDAKTETNMAESTFFEYLEALQKLYVLEDVEAWCPSIRSKTAIRSTKKKNFTDPSLAVAAMGVGPAYFDQDYKTLGFLFESLVIRDLKIYSSEHGGRISYYHDRYGLEADAVLHLEDGRYALIEVKLGQNEIDAGARHLLEIERLIIEHNKKDEQVPLRLPDLKMVITGTKYGYVRPDGVYVIPIGCLKD